MKRLLKFIVPLLLFYFNIADCQVKGTRQSPVKYGSVSIIFNNKVGDLPLILNDRVYLNPWGEQYTLTKFKYYISGIRLLNAQKKWVVKKAYFLINQSIDSSLKVTIMLPENEYDSLAFLLGVDSSRNTNGAQADALDPLNDMFWTWQSGYIMQKMEGTSPQSEIVNNKIEYHLGGFSGANSVLQNRLFTFPSNKKLIVKRGRNSSILVTADLNKFWVGKVNIKINDTPVCSAPGLLAKQMAVNFSKLFTIEDIVNNQ